ncbi:MAG: phosphoenolpyruvate--protein phosphotransferase [Desulfovibrio sp.]|jgi:phosphotransferase system enzyme I (PtsI)|nr:phosphoenolpyruvate--protein phosphotransferase [Desulfovibrio sp.]
MARAVLHGIVVSTGIAIGKGFFVNKNPESARHELVPLDRIESEAARLQDAVDTVAAEFAEARARLPGDLRRHADVLTSHLLICTDPRLGGEALRRVREQRMNAEWALEESVARIADIFNALSSPYIRDRIEDVRLVTDRLFQRLSGACAPHPTGGERGILLAHDLTPTDVVDLPIERIAAFAVAQGGGTSHTGLLARSLHIPAVIGVFGLRKEIFDGDLLIVDGLKGKLLVDPSEAELAAYSDLREQYAIYRKRVAAYAVHPAETEDGVQVSVLANVESAAEAEGVLSAGGEGVGLVRTEFGYITRSSLPGEEDLYEEYAGLAAALAPRKVTFRTLDVGGDKVFSRGKVSEEANPALGLRGIRYCVRHQDIFRTQLRAILRAGAHGNVSMMFPLISGLSELRLAKSILNEAKQELDDADVPFDPHIPVGIMIELPSAVFMADALAREVDFFSIGTNDLIQYTLGADRGNRHVAHLYQPLHPSIVRAIKQVVDMAHKTGISVCVCGEMASDPYCLPILLGMPVDELSLAPQSIPAIKHLIRRSHARQSRKLLDQALFASTANAINNMVRQAVHSAFPEDVGFFVSQLGVNR